MRRERLRRRAGVLAGRNFRRFYTGYVASLLGSSMSTVAIAWAVLDSGGSATGLGYVFAASVVPQVLLLPLAGAVADRLGRRRVMLTADVLRGGAQASLAAALFAGRPALWLFVMLAWLGGTGEAFFGPALDALTVEIAAPGPARQRERVVRAGHLGDQDRRARAERAARRLGRAGRGGGRGRGVVRR
jgi:MFS family permease